MEVGIAVLGLLVLVGRLLRDMDPPRYSDRQLRYRGHNVHV